MTGNRRVLLYPKKLLGFEAVNDWFVQYVLDSFAAFQKRAWGRSGFFQAVTVTAGPDKFSLGPSPLYGVDGDGRLLSPASTDGMLNVKFQNTNAVTYYVGLTYAEVPKGIERNPRTGVAMYSSTQEIVGRVAAPDAVVDNGDGTLTITVDSVTEAGVSNAGRTVRVYLVNPATTVEASAFEDLVVVYSGGANKVTTTGKLGQTNASGVASKYRAALIGPRVARNTDLRGVPSVAFVCRLIGAGAGGTPTVNTSDQHVFADGGISTFARLVRIDSHDEPKLRVRADSDDTDEDQIRVERANGGKVFGVDEDGDVMVGSDVVSFYSPELVFRYGASEKHAIQGYLSNLLFTLYNDDGGEFVFRGAGFLSTVRIDKLLRADLEHLHLGDGYTATDGVAFTGEDPGEGAIDGALPQNVLGAINALLAGYTAADSAIVDDYTAITDEIAADLISAVSLQNTTRAAMFANAVLSGAAVSDGGGLTVDVALGVFLRSGARTQTSASTGLAVVNGTRYVYWRASDSSYQIATDCPDFGSDLPLAKVVAAGGVVTEIVDLRRLLAQDGDRTDFIVGAAPGAHFATLREAVLCAQELAQPTSPSSTRRRKFRIHVAGDTTETATIPVGNGGGMLIEGNRKARVQWGFEAPLFEVNGDNDLAFRDLVFGFNGTGAPPDITEGEERVVVTVPDGGTSYRVLFDNCHLGALVGEPAPHGFAFIRGTVVDWTFRDCSARDVPDFFLAGSSTATMTAVRVDSCRFERTGTSSVATLLPGFGIRKGDGCTVRDCYISDARGYGIAFQNGAGGAASSRCGAYGNRIVGSGWEGIYLGGSRLAAAFNFVTAAGQDLSDAKGITVAGNRCHVDHNDVAAMLGVGTPIGIHITNSADNCIVTGNQTNNTGGIVDDGAGNTLANNRNDA